MQHTFTIVTFLLYLVNLIHYQIESTNWEQWKSQYSKQYSPKQELKRRRIWDDNQKWIKQHNGRYQLGLESYSVGMNKYSDMTSEELAKLFESKTIRPVGTINPMGSGNPDTIDPTKAVPEEWDWRNYGRVTEVKNQGLCNSGYAFAAVGALEGQLMKTVSKANALSTQQIIDCSGMGCNGGNLQSTYKYLHNYGIQNDTTYPWRGEEQSCQYQRTDVVLNITRYLQIEPGNEFKLKSYVYHYGPISVTMKFPIQMVYYKNGIAQLEPCVDYFGRQALLLVGYGVQNGTDYWLLKGSYGTDWGIQGYAKLKRNHPNMCQIASEAFYPIP